MIAEIKQPDGEFEDVRTLNVKDLADCLRVSTRQVHRLNKSGSIPRPQRIGGCTRWRAAEIVAWLEAGSPVRSEWEKQRDTQTVDDPNT